LLGFLEVDPFAEFSQRRPSKSSHQRKSKRIWNRKLPLGAITGDIP
jgi:hypothetical protein